MGSYTNDPMLIRVIQANHIHQLLGKSIWPWEVDDLPEDWLEAIETIAVEVPNRKPNG